ncbi:hypothetical protein [Acinetobacter tjernbergiae]|uniref:Peptidase S1 domain-containing protein n=1 Tax=Acinetobacter tjernbergiae DSM 14971 = CIP 107465 TaxID=1120928 RepID=V2UCB2_9GAMM|nr:hypothetical protein [Acinetobacter tjernbergiae]ESK52093.1 hypothetical protein F990_03514 [Acinetobacter tjernbergiae DSM 14971 = CIP 107465]
MLERLKQLGINFNPDEITINEARHQHNILSTRRIFHIFTDVTRDEKWDFKDLYFGQWGSGTLIKIGMKYFLLTAKHVLKDYLETEKLPNTSPFRITSHSSKGFDNIDDFLYPKKIWKIGEIIPPHEHYNFEDVVLVELFNLEFGQMVDHCINFNEMKILELSEYESIFKENILADIGFSEESNPYFHEANNEVHPYDENVYTSSTILHRDYIGGQLNKDELGYYFEKLNTASIKCTNGMSGGLILYVGFSCESKLMGMHVSGSSESDIIRFLPMCQIHTAIRDYLTAESVIIDYHYFERLAELELGVGGIAKHYDDYIRKNPKARQRNHNISKEYFDDLTDFAIKNKEFILVNAMDYAEVKGNKHEYDIISIMMDCFEKAKEARIKEGRL